MAEEWLTDNRIFRFDFTEGKERVIPVVEKKEVKKPQQKQQATPQLRSAKEEKLTPYERKFCQEYVKTNNASQSVIKAGYNVSNMNSAGVYAADLLAKAKIQNEIQRLMKAGQTEAIATSAEVMTMLTKIARGEDKDQFGLEISASDRIKAMVELAKRTVDIDNKIKAQQSGDNAITIKLDWGQNENTQATAPSVNLNLE